MNLINLKVTHKTFGEGVITACEHPYITVAFSQGDKKFQYPKAFDEYLTMEDSVLAKKIGKEIEAMKLAEIKEKKRLVDQKHEKLRQRMAKEDKGKPKAKAKLRANIAFKCNFCDGGHSDEQVGFSAVCSDDNIRNNIEVEKRTWCSSIDCACSQYLNGEISRLELDSTDFICYESKMLLEWKALAGVVQTGKRKGQPMKLNKVQNNSLCVLTTRDPNSIEKERYIFGAFLVDETYAGDNKAEGYVSTKSKYRIKLTSEEAHKMLFWNYHANNSRPEVATWSSGLHRYFDAVQAVQILRDIALLKQGSEEEALASEFLDHLARVNNIDISTVPEKNGALLVK